ncbi:MAG: hypothetical protein JWP69_2174 [Flaviaesturariibacter sp.]|nr:hypothetical protein [Flaviaesturariibacter sp.]
MITITKSLLSKVSQTIKKYEEISRLTGEDFNVFRILKVERREVGTHSALLAALLDANGAHGCGDRFLELFLEQTQIRYANHPQFLLRLQKFAPSGSRSFAEAHIGKLDNEGNSGGRIDILLKDKNGQHIVFENKIDAGDLDKQLVRYNNKYPEAPIFYLTLNKLHPTKQSKRELEEGNQYICISYKEDIRNWLHNCLKEAASYPLLRETIQQYIHLINYLTHQSNSYKMDKEIVDEITLTKSAYDAAKSIRTALNGFEAKIAAATAKEVNEVKKKLFLSEHIELFTFRNYRFKARLSNEAHHWHTDIVPYRLENGKEVFGCAGDAALAVFKPLLQSYRTDVFQNKNYLIWIFSDYNFHKLEWEDYIKLDDEAHRKAWAVKVCEEFQLHLDTFKKDVNNLAGGREIVWQKRD